MDYTTMKFKANFIWSTDAGLTPDIKKQIEDMFMTARNQLVDMLNPHYEEWNTEYDTRYGNAGYNPDGTVIEEKYLEFIQVKQNEIIDKYNAKVFKGTQFNFWADDDADICMIFRAASKLQKDAIIHLALEPIQE